tara:strand:+ start:931 stop:1350 length:420 start_codon:yes stop_codon:yes gene_type:complete
MTKSRFRKRAVPKMGNLGGVREISKKLKGSDVIFENREKIAEALMGLASAKITDILNWDEEGNVKVMDPRDIPEHALQSIRKIKAVPVGDKVQLEVEMIDKVRVLQMVAKSAGILDRTPESEKPSVIEINMVGPKNGKA